MRVKRGKKKVFTGQSPYARCLRGLGNRKEAGNCSGETALAPVGDGSMGPMADHHQPIAIMWG